ncbi:hypothetical protein [Phenylobacterium sp.]|uniref:hypothetical protein n=1 Tax=Phenylobacterium sp. TaxID=1871053 RepID=UPI002622F8B1|nr:hypothetical protein [Phenylobacterium sp.]
MSIDLRAAKKRLIVMGVIDGACLLAALAAIAVYVVTHRQPALIAFAVSLASGFGAQIWFIAGLRRPGEGA